MKPRKGSTLIEILISVAVLSSIGTALIDGLFTVYKTDLVNNNKITAVNIAQDQLEYLDSLPYLPATGLVADYGLFNGTFPAGYSVESVKGDGSFSTTHLMAAPWNSQTGAPAASEAGLQRIRLAVLQGTKVAFTIDAYKVQPESQ